ncbi:MAG: NAD(+) synthase, partial [Halanaerobiales bacterium]
MKNKAKKLDYDKVEEVLVDWIKEKVESAGAKGVVFGLSGGLDSAVTSVLCQKAFGDSILGIIMPCYSNEADEVDAKIVAEKFDINYIIRDLGSVFDEFLMVTEGNLERAPGDLALANIKPRLRMTTLYYYAAKNNYLVVGTDNWSELKVGYFTKYGDGGIDIAPLGRLVKSEVRELALHLGIPEKIITKTPSAGLWIDQTDEQEMGFSYAVLDRYILTGEADSMAEKRIEELASKSAHKLQPIPMPSR